MKEYWDAVVEMATEYNSRCDSYAEQVCTGVNAMPASNYEHKLISHHAIKVRKELRAQAECMGVDWKDVHREITRQNCFQWKPTDFCM